MDAPDDDPTHDDLRAQFGDYAQGRLDDWQRAVVDQHLYWCLDCRLVLRATLQPSDEQDRVADPDDEGRVASARRRRRWFRG